MDIGDQPARVSEARKREIFAELETERKRRKLLAQREEEFRVVGDRRMYERDAEEKLRENPADVQHRTCVSQICPSPFSPRSPNSSSKSTRSVSFQSQPFMKTPKRTSAHSTHTSSKSKEMDIERIQKEVEKEWTFTPEIHPGPKESEKELGDSDSGDIKKELGRLSTPKTNAFQEREEARKQQEEEIVRNCTFRPVISKYPIERKSSLRVDERLFQEASSLSKARRRLQSLHQESVAADCTFSPKIAHSKRSSSPPIHQRLNSIVRDRQEALESLRQHILENERNSATFHPAICPESERLARKQRDDRNIQGKDVVDGMTIEEEVTRQKRLITTRKTEEMEMEKCTFSPEVKTGGSGSWESFLRREDEAVQRMALRLSGSQKDLDNECAFSPLIDPKSALIAGETVSKGCEKSRFSLAKRLKNRDHSDPEQCPAVQHKVIQASRSLHSITPAVTSQSRLSKFPDKNLSGGTEIPSKSRGLEEEKACFFRPVLWNSRYSSARSEYGRQEDISRNIADHNKEKTRKLEEYRRMRDVEELGKCSFFPQTTQSTPRQSLNPPVVKGLETFYLHSDRAAKLRADLESREGKVLTSQDHHSKTDFSSYSKTLRTTVLKQEMQIDWLYPRRVQS